MNELDLKRLWKENHDKLEGSFTFYKEYADNTTRMKVQSMLGSMKPVKFFTLLVGILWVGIGSIALISVYLRSFSEANKFFLFSATAQVGLTGIALIIYIRQLITIYQVDLTEPIVKTQQRLSSLKISTLWATRILFLQLPFWTTFWWNESMLREWGILQWTVPLFFTFSFTVAAFWIFFNVKYANRNKQWFRLIFNGKEWTPLMQSMELLEQVQEYKEERVAI